MGNSPSQQTAEGAQGEPEEFDLNAISDGSVHNEMPPKRKKNSAKADGKSKTGIPASSVTTLKPSPVGASPLKDYDYPPAPVKDMEMKGADETSSDDNSSDVISVALPGPGQQATQTKKTGGVKSKRGLSFVEEMPVAKPRKRRREKSSPTTSVEPAERVLRQGSGTVIESTPRQRGLQALERDAELASRETTPQPRPSPRLSLISDVHQAKESGPEVSETEISEDGVKMDEPSGRRSMATSFARRTFPFVVKKAGTSSRNLQDEAGDSDDAFEDESFGDSDADSAEATSSTWPASKAKTKRLVPAQNPGSALKRPPRTPRSVRTSSKRDFDVQASDEAGSRNRPSAREKKTCAGCKERFTSRKLLEEHGQETGHTIDNVRSEVTGRFSEDEIRKLAKYKKDFCRIHDITGHAFNEMMTDSCRRGAIQAWSHDIISKQDFLEQYFDVLPNRNRKSLARFRERNWQNATGSKDWTTEDDDQIIKFVGEIGTKWVEIGQALTRTQDAVQQRWKKYLQYRDTKKEGLWSPEESEILEKSVAGAKKRSGLFQDSSTDKRIAWSVVSDALNGARTPKQCADHWQFLQESRERKERKGRMSKTPKASPKKRRKQLSAAYVDDSEKELEGNSHAQMLSKSSEDVDDDEEQGDPSPKLPPVPSKKTPNKITTLSQAFANTQANTSALRRPQRHSPSEVSDQPSPVLPSRPMLQSPATEEATVDPDEDEIAETEEAVGTTQKPSTFQLIPSKIAGAGNEPASYSSKSESEEESDNDSDGNEEVVASPKPKASPSAESASSQDELAHDVEEEPASDDELQPLPEIAPRDNLIDAEAKKPPADEDDTSSSGESVDEDSASDEETASASDDDESEDSIEKDTRNDFMESIKQSAQKAALAKQKKSVRPQLEQSESDSDSDSDSDAESIAHG